MQKIKIKKWSQILIQKITNGTKYSSADKSLKNYKSYKYKDFNGILLNIESPYGNPMLNSIRPAVLR